MYLFETLKKSISSYLDKKQVQEIQESYIVARDAHEGQTRTSGDPYITHPIAVAYILSETKLDHETIMAALLHDVIEDTEATYDDVVVNFGVVIADLVNELTDVSKPEDGNRAVRKALDRAHLAKASADAQTIKLADIISNSKDIKVNDPKFAKVYIPEMKALLEVLDKGDSELMKQAEKQVFGK